MFGTLGKVIRSCRRVSLLVLLLLVLAGAAVGLPLYARQQWRAAEAAVKDNKPSEAKSSLDFCLRVWPRNPQVLLLAARQARLAGDFTAAEAYLQQCQKLQHGPTEAIQLEYLLLRVQTGEVDEVAPLLLDCVEHKHPETTLIMETLARAYMTNLRYGPAYASLTRWIKLTPDAAQPYFWRGWVEERLHNSDDAMKDYQRALELDPEHVAARLRMAELLLDKSNPPAALPHLVRLHEQFPDRADIMARLGQCRYLEGQEEEARRLMEAAVAKLPDDLELLLYLGRLELQAGRPAEAERWLRRALKVDPYYLEASFSLATSLNQQGRKQEADAVLEKRDEHQALLERANKLLKEEAEHPGRDARIPAEAGALLLRVGNDRLGLYWLHQALERDADNRPAHLALAEYYEGKNDEKNAAAHRRRLAAGDKKAGGP